MNYNLLRHHLGLIFALFALIGLTMATSMFIGDSKPVSTVEWTDVAGEGGIALITLVWIFFTLISRPAGRVTQLLVWGLMFMHVSLLLDLLDEFFRYPENHAWLSAYESIPAPIGMILLTAGLYHWHLEQRKVNEQLRKRERIYREHDLIDPITNLYNADYMGIQITHAINARQDVQKDSVLAMLDVDEFDALVQTYGDEYCDQLLQEIAEILILHIRPEDLACRYAGDRFVLLMSNTNPTQAKRFLADVTASLQQCRFKPMHDANTVRLSVSQSLTAIESTDTYGSVYSRLNQYMEQVKLARVNGHAA